MSFYEDASWLLIPSGIEEDVVFAQKPTSGLGDLTFTRASDATYTDSTGVVRRSPYNLLTFSEDFSNAAWFKQQMNVSSNVAANPLTGVVNADLLVPDTTSNNHRIFQIATVSSSIQSVYLKAAGYNYVSFGKGGGTSGSGIIFNLSNGTVSGSASGFSGTISPAGNGWYLCSLISSGSTNDYASTSNWIIIRDNSTNLVFTGDGTSGVLVANAQLVEGNEALPYFPTTNRQDVPRIDFRNADGTLSSCGRLLLEPQRTNSIRNSSMVGAVAGTPGTLPTNWGVSAAGGLTTSVVGVGTENGLPYVDVRINGTATGTAYQLRQESTTTIVASVGQVWTGSAYIKKIAEPAPPLSYRTYISEHNAAGTELGGGSFTINPTTSLQRFAQTRTLSNASTERVLFSFFASLTNGAAYDFTIRIAAPQMELGAYATTWVPTTTAAVTRLADFASKTGVSSLIGQSQGTLFVEVNDAVLGNVFSGTGRRFLTISDNTLNNRIILFKNSSNDSIQFVVVSGGVEQASISTSTNQSGVKKIAAGYANNDFVLYVNGVQIGADTSGAVPSCDRIALGFETTVNLSNPACPVAQAALFPTRLDNATLAQLTTL